VTRGGKKPVNLTLSAELVREVRKLTPNLSETIGGLLEEAYVAGQRAKQVEQQSGLEAAVAWANELHDTHGLPGEDFSPL
jgi:post-segregation antitoxin (ccd killing protein)